MHQVITYVLAQLKELPKKWTFINLLNLLAGLIDQVLQAVKKLHLNLKADRLLVKISWKMKMRRVYCMNQVKLTLKCLFERFLKVLLNLVFFSFEIGYKFKLMSKNLELNYE